MHPDPPRLQAYVSSDPSVAVTGSELPFGPRGMRNHTVDSVVAAVSALSRRTLDELARRGPPRTLLIQALKALTPLSDRQLARGLGVSASAIHQTRPLPGAALARIERVLGDPRFTALDDGPLTSRSEWRRYRSHRLHTGAHDLMLEKAGPQLRRRNQLRRP